MADSTTHDRKLIEMPADAKETLLPDLHDSLLGLLKFPLPIVTQASGATLTIPSFYSREAVNYDSIENLRKIPVPPLQLLDSISAAYKAMVRAGHKSIVCAHLTSTITRYLPLWILVYWNEVASLRAIRKPWSRADESLRGLDKVWQKKRAEGQIQPDHSLIQEVYDALAILPWSETIRGFSNSEPLHTLAVYLSPKAWFSDVHQHQSIDLLRRDLRLNRASGTIVEPLDFFTKLKQAYRRREDGVYESDKEWAWVRGVGQALANGKSKAIGLIINVNENHWVALVVDFEHSRFLYGDPKGWAPNSEVVDVIDWWTTYHTGVQFVQEFLKTAPQSTDDNHNCGMLASNALTHHCLPELHPLLDVRQLEQERLKMFLRVIERHHDQTFDAVAQPYQFSFSSPIKAYFKVKPDNCAVHRSPSLSSDSSIEVTDDTHYPAIASGSRPSFSEHRPSSPGTRSKTPPPDIDIDTPNSSQSSLPFRPPTSPMTFMNPSSDAVVSPRSSFSDHSSGGGSRKSESFMTKAKQRLKHSFQRVFSDSEQDREMSDVPTSPRPTPLTPHMSLSTFNHPRTPTPPIPPSGNASTSNNIILSPPPSPSTRLAVTSSEESLPTKVSIATTPSRSRPCSRPHSRPHSRSHSPPITGPSMSKPSKRSQPCDDDIPIAAAPKRARVKAKGDSSVRKGLEKLAKGATRGNIMTFFQTKLTTEDEKKEQRVRVDEELAVQREKQQEKTERYESALKRKGGASVAERVRKFRMRKKTEEIALGVRDSNGKKRKASEHTLNDLQPPPSKRQNSTAELSRPDRKANELLKAKTRKPQGRKRTVPRRDAVYTNWHGPFVWRQIEAGQRAVGWSPSALAKWLARRDPETFGHIARETIRDWIDNTDKFNPQWTDAAKEMAKAGDHQSELNKGGKKGIFTKWPDVLAVIIQRLEALRDVAAPISLVTVRGIVVATIQKMRPEIFEERAKDGSTFRCSDSFLRQFLHANLGWSERRATQAAQKLPENWEEQCEKAFLRMAWTIKEEDIPSALIVNSDQTQLVYAQGSKLTWTKTGSKQVKTVGEDEKRAFTVVVSLSNDGEILPFQSIYTGQTVKVCPETSAPHYDDAVKAGFRFEPSKTKTYWSNQRTMRSLVDDIIAPYFQRKKKELGLPESQKSIWFIDVWSVHRSEEFRTWMKNTHPTIIILFVPGGCTGVFQPCDVGMQRIFKISCKKSYHADVVDSILVQLDNGAETIQLAKNIAFLRDRSVGWLWTAYEKLNRTEIVQKAFEMCRTGEYNLSYQSLTDLRTTRARLNNLKATDPEFYAELTSTTFEDVNVPSAADEELDEDLQNDPDFDATFEDDSNVPMDVVCAVVARSQPTVPIKFSAAGEIAIDVAAESNDPPEESICEEVGSSETKAVGEVVKTVVSEAREDGKRIRTKTKKYSDESLKWWREF